jgi:cysteinyl-tRNA synthetase
MIRGEEMHKSLGNFVSLDQAFTRWDPMVIRFFVLLSHYRGPIDFTEDAIEAAAKGLERLTNLWHTLLGRSLVATEGPISTQVAELVERTRQTFEESMNDDFNTPGAVAALFDMTREVNSLLSSEALNKDSLSAISDFLQRTVGDVLGITLSQQQVQMGADLTNGLVDILVETRTKLRQAKQWSMADDVRKRLTDLGIDIRDGADGTSWQLRQTP